MNQSCNSSHFKSILSKPTLVATTVCELVLANYLYSFTKLFDKLLTYLMYAN